LTFQKTRLLWMHTQQKDSFYRQSWHGMLKSLWDLKNL